VECKKPAEREDAAMQYWRSSFGEQPKVNIIKPLDPALVWLGWIAGRSCAMNAQRKGDH
jgi:hypothetical protein